MLCVDISGNHKTNAVRVCVSLPLRITDRKLCLISKKLTTKVVRWRQRQKRKERAKFRCDGAAWVKQPQKDPRVHDGVFFIFFFSVSWLNRTGATCHHLIVQLLIPVSGSDSHPGLHYYSYGKRGSLVPPRTCWQRSIPLIRHSIALSIGD